MGLTPDSVSLWESLRHGADPERALAIVHAPAAARPALTTLFLLDLRFGEILAATRDPQIGAMRLTWWREALEKLDITPPPAEPLLEAVAETLLPRGLSGDSLGEMEDGWYALLEGDPPGAELIRRHGAARGGALFVLAGRLLAGEAADGSADLLRAAGTGWALVDLSRRLSDPIASAEARAQAVNALESIGKRRWPRSLRPLGMLARLAIIDAHAAAVAQPGSPARMLRMAWHRLSGR